MRTIAVVRRSWVAVVAAMLATSGCSEDVVGPEESPLATITVDAESEWAFVRLSVTPTQVTVADPMVSEAWHIGFRMTQVRLNAEEGGPGEVEAICLCANQGATDEQVMAMTAASELADFEAVTVADIPPQDAAWTAAAGGENGVFGSVPYYRYNLAGGHQIWPTFNVYLVRSGAEIYKVQIINYYGPAGERRQITLRSARLVG